MTAREALLHIDGDLSIRLHENFTQIEGELVPLTTRSIVRHPTLDNPEYAVLGQAGPEYSLITPGDVADLWDAHVGCPIETMGCLKQGAIFFCTTRLPTLDVKGDPVEMYLAAFSPMDGQRSASAEIVPVRVICMNTLRLAQAQAQISYRVVHDAGARERFGLWLREAYERAISNSHSLAETFDFLASKTISDNIAASIIRRAYPDPRRPRFHAPDETMAVRLERWEKTRERILHRRETALALFKGDGTGMDSRAAMGTTWGCYNAITETENFRKGFAKGGLAAEDRRVGEDILTGARGEAMARAFSACLAVAGGGPESGGFPRFDPSLN